MKRSFLFLQGPLSPFFAGLGAELVARGHAVHRINLSLGDWLQWRGWAWPITPWQQLGAGSLPAVNFTGRMADWPGFVTDFLECHGITDLILLGEQRPYHRIAISAAQARGISVTATDFGYLRPDWIILERDGHNVASHYPRDAASILALAEGAPPVEVGEGFEDSFPAQAAWDVQYHIANTAFWPFRHYRSPQLHHPVPAYLGTLFRLSQQNRRRRHAEELLARLPEDAPFFLFAMQMENDFSVRAYSPYPDMDSPLREAVESFARHAPDDAHLAVKVHPLDPGLKNWPRRLARMARAAGVDGRVHLMDGIALDPLIARSAGLVTVNSTAGVRALQLGKPVLALGEALYKVPGLAHLAGPDRFWRGVTPPDPVLLDAFLRGIARHLHVRGVFYHVNGLRAAIQASADRLEGGLPELAATRPLDAAAT